MNSSSQVDISYKVKTIVLADYYTLMDVAYIYTWKRVSKHFTLPRKSLYLPNTRAHVCISL